MAIAHLKVSNFKTFNDLQVDLAAFNVVIGRNAAGKSNFVQIFRFLRDLTLYGLSDAISLQGGIRYLTNLNLGTSDPLSVSVLMDANSRFTRGRLRNYWGFLVRKMQYSFTLAPKRRRESVAVIEDQLTLWADVVHLESRKFPSDGLPTSIGEATIRLTIVKQQFVLEAQLPPGVDLSSNDLSPMLGEPLPKNMLIIESPYQPLPVRLTRAFRDIGIYDFDPRLPKKAVPITGKATLEEDGSNLALILRSVIAHRDTRRTFTNLIRDLLPFVSNVNVERFADKSMMFKLKETYTHRHYLPASLVSDGTINVTALLLAMYFSNQALTVIEEPERNIHPHLISKLVEMMKDAALTRQLLVTTHNPELVKHAGLEHLLFMTRDPRTGWSSISRPTNSKSIRNFLRHEIGIDDLYVQNLLGSPE